VVVFDMDRTILSDSFIQTAARHFGFEKAFGKLPLSMSILSLEPKRLLN
jgi:phosphoserine phosphatase